MKYFKDILSEVGQPKAPEEKRFKNQHEIEKIDHPVASDSQFSGDIEGLSEADVKQYIRHIADRRLLQLGMKPKFGVKDNPLPWLDWVLNGASHDNFFEKRVTEYSVNGMEGDWGWIEEPESCGLDGNAVSVA